MESNSGIIYDKFTQIKMLILFVMSRLPQPISMEMLAELTMCDDRISYFDVTECIGKLAGTKHLKLENGKYTLTAKGLRNGKILEEDLPFSVREKAKDAAEHIKRILVLDASIKTRREALDQGGLLIGLSFSDGVGDVLSVELYAANGQQADLLEKGFRKNAPTLYHDIVDIICK